MNQRYVDGFVLPIARARLNDYRALAEEAALLWKEYGALEYWECLGDDLEAVGSRSFPQMTAASEDETVIFAWAVFESKEARDAANTRMMADPRMKKLANPEDPIFDCQRMAFGGFREWVRG